MLCKSCMVWILPGKHVPKSRVMQMLRGKHYLDSLKIVSIRGISAAKDLDITRTVDTPVSYTHLTLPTKA